MSAIIGELLEKRSAALLAEITSKPSVEPPSLALRLSARSATDSSLDFVETYLREWAVVPENLSIDQFVSNSETNLYTETQHAPLRGLPREKRRDQVSDPAKDQQTANDY